MPLFSAGKVYSIRLSGLDLYSSSWRTVVDDETMRVRMHANGDAIRCCSVNGFLELLHTSQAWPCTTSGLLIFPAEETHFEVEPTETEGAKYYGLVAFLFFGIVGGFIVGVDLLNLLQVYPHRKRLSASKWRARLDSPSETRESFSPWRCLSVWQQYVTFCLWDTSCQRRSKCDCLTYCSDNNYSQCTIWW